MPVLEAVPNFSEGRDLALIRQLVGAIAREGADVLDWSADPDHNRSVITFIGEPARVEAAAVAAARFAIDNIDLRGHSGVHPRIGAIDVLPLVPLRGLTLADAATSARRVGRRIADLGLPVYFYGAASEPPGRTLAPIRRGGFEAMMHGFPKDQEPDLPAGGGGLPHPTAGAVCVGARKVLLAWNVYVEGVEIEDLEPLAASLRESGGGFARLRALALALPSRQKLQISMNLEDLDRTSPMDVFMAVEKGVHDLGGTVSGTEVIGMLPDPLVHEATRDRLMILEYDSSRALSRRVHEYTRIREINTQELVREPPRDFDER
ncbi:MAG: glutamate formimidoyltransferase [Gemmatimonadota bacterium]|nr:MAG: glutamate formimidoyltransferase [Gemmatimonadota bacterium]